MNKLVLIDGNALLYRAFHAYPPFVTPEGELVGAVYGFTTLLLSVLEKLSPSHVVVAWDLKGPTKRKLSYEDYKANRAPMDDDLVAQISRTKEVVEAMNIPQLGLEGYEADDVIGTVSKKAVVDFDEVQVVIVTGDRDALQLIQDKRIVVYLPIQNKYSKSVVFDQEMFEKTYEMLPEQLIDLKGLMGDSSDNIPGVRGVGKVTATKLIKDFGSIENIYSDIENEKIPARIRKLLVEDKEMAFKSKELATIDKNSPVELDWNKCLLKDYDRQKVESLFEKLGFKSLVGRLPGDSWEKEVKDIFI